MNDQTWAIQSQHVVTPTGTRPGAILIRGGKIVDIIDLDQVPPGIDVEDYGDLAILPGLVDTHVHINDPGRADWEGFATATAAAAAGGITTLIDMPLNSSPVTTTVEALAAKRAASVGKLRVDVGFFGGLVPGNTDQIEPLADAGVVGFKAFLSHSGIDEFPNVGREDLLAAMPILARRGLPLLAHAEIVPDGAPPMDPAEPTRYAAWLESRPESFEIAAIQLLIDLCCQTGCPVHIVHLATASALYLIENGWNEGLPISVETCPHYLTFAAEEIPDADPRFKCAPPIRSAANRDGLWEGLIGGLIETIGTDHSPAPPDLKHLDTGDLAGAWGGIASLQISLSAVWTEARTRDLTLDELAQWLAAAPARLVGLEGIKGRIAPGCDADLVVFDPDAEFVVDSRQLHHRHPATPYEGRTLAGRVVATYLRGERIAVDGQTVGEPTGQTLGTGLVRLDSMTDDVAHAALLHCCHSAEWAESMRNRRPFGSGAALATAAETVWNGLTVEDQAEAFTAHPRIGDLASLRAKYAATAGSAAQEQAGASGADEATLHALAAGNQDYEVRFGHIFIVCATGKTAEEMLAILQSRLPNDPATEHAIAAAEQLKITQIRLRKLCS